MGNYFYDDYEAKMKVTNDIINDNNFYQKMKQNFVSPKYLNFFKLFSQHLNVLHIILNFCNYFIIILIF